MFQSVRIAVLLVVCIVAVGVALFTVLTPEFTDEQIRESVVDTWEPSAFVTSLLLCVLAFFALLALTISIFSKGIAERLLAAVAVLLALGAAALEFRSHAVLTERTTALTGEEFESCYGLC